MGLQILKDTMAKHVIIRLIHIEIDRIARFEPSRGKQ
ncbi:hypothetical protein BN381_70038 [Candidatus Microthrix parvicella RN1]|uniref:Uncharacterized protein n=1 Tax=Candidatus Neomicrothrix parvicella RN1 TaxID=1229780 RepID=R4Z360_9ACTN|nr:hypothetical protein BN381_70038 [Candidatus Microthrix parvicella RN1]